ncbi:hypothetical protein LCGC14_1093830 [marine sediment metagenome]|uniref:EVE domain-containing protein n=1 Tax=marine sediment metagenome TaxID=412755 RepID=A0A0F9PUQ6_9ZZZZ
MYNIFEMERDEPKFWIFQSNPEKLDIENAINELEKDVFTVNQYKKEIRKSDKVLFWVSGAKGGFVGYGEVLTSPEVIDQNPEAVKFIKEKDLNKKSLRVWVSYNKIKQKILNVDLQEEYFYMTEKMCIFKNPQGTNFPIDKEIWDFFVKNFISRLIIPFSVAMKKELNPPDIYRGEEEIQFNKRDSKFKETLINEFLTESKDSKEANNGK